MRSKKSKKDFAEAYMYLVEDLAGKAYKKYNGIIPFNDLSSAGNFGLAMAIDTFDKSRGVPFKAFARNSISYSINDCVRDFFGRGQKSTRRVIFHSADIVDKAEHPSDLKKEIEEGDEGNNKKLESVLEQMKSSGVLDEEKHKLFKSIYIERRDINELSAFYDTLPNKLSELSRAIKKEIRNKIRAGIESANKIETVTKEETKKEPPKKLTNSAMEWALKEIEHIDKIMETNDLRSLVYENKSEDQGLKESLEYSERKNPKLGELLDQLEGKGADRYEVAKILVNENEDLYLFRLYLELKKAVEKDKNKQTIKPAALEYLFSKPRNRKEQTKIFEKLPGMNDEHLLLIEARLKAKGYDLTKISQGKPQMWPVFTKIMVDLYDYLDPFFDDKHIHMIKITKKPAKYKSEVLSIIAELMQLCFKECKNLTTEKVKSRIQKYRTYPPANQNL